ncbi:MAG: hypothetical protein AB7U41_04305, partial [Dongiaceae bacterium]
KKPQKRKKPEPKAFGRIVQHEGYHIEKVLFDGKNGIRIVGETNDWGVVRISLQAVLNGTWTEIRSMSYSDAMKVEKALERMRKLLNV